MREGTKKLGITLLVYELWGNLVRRHFSIVHE